MSDYLSRVRYYSNQFGEPYWLMHNIGSQESGWNPRARSSAGAKGLFQLMDDTAAEMGVTDPYDPEQNIRAGIGYYHKLKQRYGNDTDALSAYNSGQPWRIGQR